MTRAEAKLALKGWPTSLSFLTTAGAASTAVTTPVALTRQPACPARAFCTASMPAAGARGSRRALTHLGGDLAAVELIRDIRGAFCAASMPVTGSGSCPVRAFGTWSLKVNPLELRRRLKSRVLRSTCGADAPAGMRQGRDGFEQYELLAAALQRGAAHAARDSVIADSAIHQGDRVRHIT